jgi:hypothetical protein
MGPGKSELERESFSSVLIVTLIARWVVGLRYHPAAAVTGGQSLDDASL